MKLVPQLLKPCLIVLLSVLSLNPSSALALGLSNPLSGAWLHPGIAATDPSSFIQPTSQNLTSQPLLRTGSEGDKVKAIQIQLKNLGYYDSDISGTFDHQTEAAVVAFQQNHNLVPDGLVGMATLRQLQGEDNLSSALTTSTVERSPLPLDIQRIQNRGKLVVALLGADNPPFFMAGAEGELDGLDVKIAQGIAEALEVEVEFNRSATTFNEVVDQVYHLYADIAISKLSRTLKRSIKVRFSNPYVSMRQSLLVNRLQLAEQSKGRSVIETIRDLKGKVGVIEGSSYVGFLQQKFPNAAIEEYPAWEDIVIAVSKGDLLAGYRDELEVKKIVLSKPDAALQLQTIALTDTEDTIAMAFPWDSTHLVEFVDQYLDTMNLDYTADLVLEEYAGYFQPQ